MRTLQRELADAGWPGQFVHVSSSVPPELQALRTARLADTQTGVRVDSPGEPPQYMGPAEVQEIMRETARLRAERQEAIAKMMGPLDKTLAQ